MFSHPFAPRIARRFLRIRVRAVPKRSEVPAAIPNSTSTKTVSPPKLQSPKNEIVPPKVENYAYRWETTQPKTEDLGRADSAFERYPAVLGWSQAKFREIAVGTAPEVAFLGRSNVGKSSLLNALMNHKGLAYTSSRPGKTKTMTSFIINRGQLVLVDMPGYGHASRTEWGAEIMKYLKNRKELRRAFVLIDAKHGPKPMDLLLLEQLGNLGISYQVVLSKIDRLNRKDGSVEKAFEDAKTLVVESPGVSGLGEVLGVAGDPSRKGPRIGIPGLRWAVLRACGIVQ